MSNASSARRSRSSWPGLSGCRTGWRRPRSRSPSARPCRSSARNLAAGRRASSSVAGDRRLLTAGQCHGRARRGRLLDGHRGASRSLPLLAVVWLFVAARRQRPASSRWPRCRSRHGGIAATALTFFALTGFEAATAPVGKVRDPSRNIPRATDRRDAVRRRALSVGRHRDPDAVARPTASRPRRRRSPTLVAALGPWRRAFAALAIAVSAFGCLNGLILGTGELGYAMALRGDLPSVMARTRGVNTPVVAQLVGAALTILLLLANSSRATANLYTFIILLSTARSWSSISSRARRAGSCSPAMRARAAARHRSSSPSRLLRHRARSDPVVPRVARRRPCDPWPSCAG